MNFKKMFSGIFFFFFFQMAILLFFFLVYFLCMPSGENRPMPAAATARPGLARRHSVVTRPDLADAEIIVDFEPSQDFGDFTSSHVSRWLRWHRMLWSGRCSGTAGLAYKSRSWTCNRAQACPIWWTINPIKMTLLTPRAARPRQGLTTLQTCASCAALNGCPLKLLIYFPFAYKSKQSARAFAWAQRGRRANKPSGEVEPRRDS